MLLHAATITLPFAFAAAQQQTPDVTQQPTQGAPAQPAPAKPKPKPKPAAAKKPAPAVETKAKLLEKINDWTVFVYEDANGRVCFAASAPTEMQPKSVKRNSVIFYVTTWQKDGIRNEVSVRQGYAMKANATATVTVGNQNFTLTALDDKAFSKDPAEERKLVAAMEAGGPMSVKATSAKGAATTDQYSLDGMAAAVQKMQEACP
jgi:hypothetical protein